MRSRDFAHDEQADAEPAADDAAGGLASLHSCSALARSPRCSANICLLWKPLCAHSTAGDEGEHVRVVCYDSRVIGE
jgi:hypothetical protein